MNHIGLIGAGAVGKALASAIAQTGMALQCVIDKSAARARELALAVGAPRSGTDYRLIGSDVELLIVAIPDDQLPDLDRTLARKYADFSVNACVHTAGALPGSILEELDANGVSVGSLHPLQTFPKQGPPPSLQGVYFTLEGDENLTATLKVLVQKIGGIPVVIPADKKAVYHAAAVFASNFLPVLVRESLDLLGQAGIREETGHQMIAPLMRESLENCLHHGAAEAITGPVMRGDVETIRLHLEALKESSADASVIYRILSLKALELAVERGLPTADADRIQKLLTG
jgi:predicted short-subunit dehydrogenase-like oxidoreductase (DUF2520 family)